MKELLKKLLPKIGFMVSSSGLYFGPFYASKPDAKNNTNLLARRIAQILAYYFKVDQDSAYAVVQAELPRIDVSWFSGTADVEDDDPEFLKVLEEILLKAIEVKGELKTASLQLVKEYTVNTIKLQPGSIFNVVYSTEDELTKIKSKFEGIAVIL